MKEFFGTTLPARLEKYEGLLKSRDEGKGFFLGAKVSMRDIKISKAVHDKLAFTFGCLRNSTHIKLSTLFEGWKLPPPPPNAQLPPQVCCYHYSI